MKIKPLLLLFVAAFVPSVYGADAQTLSATQCWIRMLPATAAAYFTLDNPTEHPQTLIEVAADGFGMAMLHQTKNVGGTMKMTDVDEVPVPAHGRVEFAPGSYHVMLMEPSKAPAIGSTLPLTLSFKGGAHITTRCVVKAADATGEN